MLPEHVISSLRVFSPLVSLHGVAKYEADIIFSLIRRVCLHEFAFTTLCCQLQPEYSQRSPWNTRGLHPTQDGRVMRTVRGWICIFHTPWATPPSRQFVLDARDARDIKECRFPKSKCFLLQFLADIFTAHLLRVSDMVVG